MPPKSGVSSVPWSALKPFKGVVSGKAVTGNIFLKEAQVSMFGGLLATAETKNKSVTRTVASVGEYHCVGRRYIRIVAVIYNYINIDVCGLRHPRRLYGNATW